MAEGGHVIHAVAKYDFMATDDGELSIKKTERLLVLDESSRWWKVQNIQGQSGIVPSNYLKKCKPSFFESLRNTLRRRGVEGARDQIAVLPTKDDLLIESFKTIAIYNYEAQMADELSLVKGDVVIVEKKSNDGWWNGRNENGHSGWFPSNYVKLLLTKADYSVSVEKIQKLTYDDVGCTVTTDDGSTGNCEEVLFNKNRLQESKSDIFSAEDDTYATSCSTESDTKDRIGQVSEFYKPSLPVNSYIESSFNEDSSCRSSSVDLPKTDKLLDSDHLVSTKDWFIGKVTRAQCEQAMRQHAQSGDFIIRESETHVGEYTLTMKARDYIKHFRIKLDADRQKYLIGQQTFHALDDLVEHYKKHAIYRLGNEKVFLLRAFAITLHAVTCS